MDANNDAMRLFVNAPGLPALQAALADGASGNRPLELRLLRYFLAAYRVWQARQKEYGPHNIAKAGAQGCVAMALQKAARLEGRFQMGNGTPEAALDNYLDAVNYFLMGGMCHFADWPGAAPLDEGLVRVVRADTAEPIDETLEGVRSPHSH